MSVLARRARHRAAHRARVVPYDVLMDSERAAVAARREPARSRLADPDLDQTTSSGTVLPLDEEVPPSVRGLRVVDDESDRDGRVQEHRDHPNLASEFDAEPLPTNESAPHDELKAREIRVGDHVVLVPVDQGSHNDSPSLDVSGDLSVGEGPVGEVPPASLTGSPTGRHTVRPLIRASFQVLDSSLRPVALAATSAAAWTIAGLLDAEAAS